MNQIINGLSVNTFGNPEKQHVVFVHGFPYDHTMWENQIKFLEKDYYCVAYDVRGLGESFVGDGQYTLEFFVDDLLTVISVLKLTKPVLCGLSMGGYIALRAIERHQDLFKALILMDTRPEADDNAGKLKRAAAINQINVEGLKKFADAFVTNCFSDEAPENQKETFLSTLSKSYKHDPIGVKGCIIAILSRTDTTASLHNIKIPVLVICGSFDKLTPPPVMRAMAEKIPGAEFAVVPGAGHMSPLENPDNVNDLIGGFFKRKLG